MGKHRQVSDPVRGPRAGWPRTAARAAGPSLGALAMAGLLGGCAVASSGQPAGSASAAGPVSTARCAAAGSGGAGSGGPVSGGPVSGGAPLQAIQFTSDGHGWAAGAGRILATSDGGRTWAAQYTGPAALGQLDFTSASDGWAVGPGALLRTTDGGARWTALREPLVNGHCLTVSSVHFVSPVLGYAIAGPTGAASAGAGAVGAGAVGGGSAGAGGPAEGGTGGAGGQLLRTADGGVTWQLAAGAPDGARAVCFSTAQDGYLGVPGRIWRTTDAGASWSPAFTEPPATAGQQASRAASDAPELGCAAHGAAWALFLGGGAAMMHAPYLAYATQDGRNWHGVLEDPMLETAIRPRLRLPAGPGSEPGPFSVISPGAAAFVGYTPPANGWGAAPLIVATNGGTVLRSAGDIPAINQPLAAAFLTPARGWVVGENLKTHTFSIEATTDAGRSWTTQYTTS